MMRRREVIALLGGATVAWPLAARAQQANRMRRVGALIGGGESTLQMQARYGAFKEGLEARGWFENRNLRIDVRFANASDQLRAAAELVALAPEVILSAPVGLRPLQQMTSTIPVVFVLLLDPVGTGFVASLARPAGNMTGFAVFDPMNSTKQMALFKQVAPHVDHMTYIYDPVVPGITQMVDSSWLWGHHLALMPRVPP